MITDPEPLRVLLVEDNPGDARLVREMLAEMNTERYEVIATDRLADTLAALAERPFDAILLDLNLPDSYGLATLIKIRTVAPHVPVIVVSGLADEEMAIHALREGAYTYLVKGQMNGYLLNRSIRYSIERMRSEQIQQLQRAREYAENIVDTIREVLIVLDNRLRIVSANRAFYETFQTAPEKIEGRFIHELADQVWNIPEFLALLERILLHSNQQEGLELDHEFPILGRRVMLLNARWVYEERGETDRILLAISDITERKRAEEALAAEKERLAVTLWNIGEGVIVADVRGTISLLNRTAEQLTGWTAQDAIGRRLDEVFLAVDERTGEPCGNPVAMVLQPGSPRSRSRHKVLVARDGTERPLGETVAPVRDGHGDIIGVVIVFRDLTAERRVEEDLAKNERLESVGVLAGGIAHDFNNTLTAIEGNILVAKAHLPEDQKAYERLVEAEKAAHRARDLTRQLLTFARGGQPIKKVLRLSELLADSTLFALSGSTARAEFAIAEGSLGRRGRRGAAQAGDQQPGDQRRPGHAGGRDAHGLGRERRARRGGGPDPRGGRLRPDPRLGYRGRDPEGARREDLRAVLHDQADRERARADRRLLDRAQPRRDHRGRSACRGGRHRLHRLLPRQPRPRAPGGRGCGVRRAAATSGSSGWTTRR